MSTWRLQEDDGAGWGREPLAGPQTDAAQLQALLPGSTTVLVVAAMLAGLIFGMAAGLLHKRDGASVAGAVIRACMAWAGGTTTCLAIFFSSNLLFTFVVLLVSTICGIAIAILYRIEGKTILAAVWCGGVTFMAVATLGNGVLAVYSASEDRQRDTQAVSTRLEQPLR